MNLSSIVFNDSKDKYWGIKNIVFLMVFGILAVTMIVFVFMANFTFTENQNFYFLAQSFLNGKLSFMQPNALQWNDVAWFNNRAFWPLGPFPTVLLLPFVYLFSFIGLPFYQGYLQFFLLSAILYFVFKLARLNLFSRNDSIILSFAFFSSAFFFLVLAPTSYYFAQVIVVLLLFAALYEFLSLKRYWIIGLFLGLALITRIPAGFGIVFFIFEILCNKNYNLRQKVFYWIKLLAPFIVLALFLLVYNYARFGNLWEQGYSYQINMSNVLRYTRDYGLFNLVHLPGNLYYLLLSIPQPVFRDGISHVLKFPFIKPDLWGMSIFFTSPYFIYLFAFKYRDLLSKLLFATVLIIALPILLYYGIGYQQFGYRYAFDFMPFLYLLFMREYHNKYAALSSKTKWLILASAAVNFYLFFALNLTVKLGI